jgi:Cd2+/Zn2+-exporting ATPase
MPTKNCCCESCNNNRLSLFFKPRIITGIIFFAVGMTLEYGLIRIPSILIFINMELIIFLVSYILIGSDVLIRCLKNIRHGKIFDENFLMGISTIGAFCIDEYPEAVAIMLFYQIGEAFQDAAVEKSRASITALMDIRPDYARLVTADGNIEVSPSSVEVGSNIIVRPGERIPLDGIIADGASSLDVSALTGESMPKDAAKGDVVLSGAINNTGILVIKVTKNAEESTVSKILKLVEESAEKKSRMENFITKFARFYTPAVVFSAILMAFALPVLSGDYQFKKWIYKSLVFLVVSCPCALVISIPLTFFAGLGAASKNGILIKGSCYLSALCKINTVIFDKTGTLTKGVFKVCDIYPSANYNNNTLLYYTVCAESSSNHPAASALRDSFGSQTGNAIINDFEERAGLGVKAIVDGKTIFAGNAALLTKENIPFEIRNNIGTIIYVAIDGNFAGSIIINDEIKNDAVQAVLDLRALGVNNIAIFTGDTNRQALAVAQIIGIKDVYSEMLPYQKAEKIEYLVKNKIGKGNIIFAGDGINDAPSLAISDIGVAMGAGSDAAIEAADIVLMTSEPHKISRTIQIARRTQRIVVQNIILALSIKAAILIFGVLGAAKIWGAVFGDVGVALIAVLNATRAFKTVKPFHLRNAFSKYPPQKLPQ